MQPPVAVIPIAVILALENAVQHPLVVILR